MKTLVSQLFTCGLLLCLAICALLYSYFIPNWLESAIHFPFAPILLSGSLLLIETYTGKNIHQTVLASFSHFFFHVWLYVNLATKFLMQIQKFWGKVPFFSLMERFNKNGSLNQQFLLNLPGFPWVQEQG